MFYLKFPNIGPEKTILIFAVLAIAHSFAFLFMIFNWDSPALAPTLVRFPSLYHIFRIFLSCMMVLYVPAVLLPVGSALGAYKAHPVLPLPFTLLSIIDLLISFGYTIAYLPFLLLRVMGSDFDEPVTINSIIVSVMIFALKLLFQVCEYSTVHKAIEEMTHIDDSSPYSLDSIHTVVNVLTCCAEKMYDLDLLAIGLENTKATRADEENQNSSNREGNSSDHSSSASSSSDKGEEKEKRTGFQIKRLKVVQEPNKPIAYVHHPVQIPAVLRNAEFDTGTELGSIYNKFKERAKERHGFDPQQPTTRAQYVAPHSGLVDVNKPLPKRNFMPTYHKQSWKQTPGGFKPKSNTQFI